MDETSSKTITSVPTANDTDSKCKKYEEKKKNIEETASGLSKKDIERETKSNLEPNEENKSPRSKKVRSGKKEGNGSGEPSGEVIVNKETNNSDIIEEEEVISNDEESKSDKSLGNDECSREKEEEASDKEKSITKESIKDESELDEPTNLRAAKSNGYQVSPENGFRNPDKKNQNKDEGTDSPSLPEEKDNRIHNNEPEKDSVRITTPNIPIECDKSEESPTTSENSDIHQSSATSNKMQTATVSSNKKFIDERSSVENDSPEETKCKDEITVVCSTNKYSEKGKPQQNSCTSECHNQPQERQKQKRVTDANTVCESSSTATKNSTEPHSSSLPTNSVKVAPAVAKLNTFEILTARHLNDASKFEIFKGLIEVGKMTNKEVVNAVLYLVRKE